MYFRLDRPHRLLPLVLGVITLAGVAALFIWDIFPGLFPAGSHDFLAAFSLAMIAISYLVYQVVHRPAPLELAKAILLAVAFLFWAANQFWSRSPLATLFNDIAVGLFVLDVFWVIVGWPESGGDRSFAETEGD
jgi:predicted membrane metal-binding protein